MFSTHFIKQTFTTAVQPVVLKQGSKRRRLWELASHVHCPVIGVCLPMAALRRLVVKAAPEMARLDDYALHSAAVQMGRSRNRLAESIQDELDQRHATIVKALRRLPDRVSLEAAWQEAVTAGEIAGALWATLTHPACDPILAEVISQQMHMIQHQAGASLRLDIAHYRALQEENAALARSLATAQQRCERQSQEKAGELEQLQAQLIRTRSEVISRDTELGALREELEALRAAVPDQAARRRLEHQLMYQEERNARLCLENARLRKELDAALSAPAPSVALANASVLPDEVAPEASLEGHRILCVGGRENVVVVYRKLIEQAGGQFLHHDGGVEDRFGQLDSALGAADLVICQTGCISHNAYWRVKDHCKRTGKRCAFVENPSAAGLARGLRCLLSDALVESQDEVQTAVSGSAMTAGMQQT
ncbi:DUF2325 domain-containing protein [Uliginosibacterium aquaticum]|uniref:DUF2325 domain-containing protein n=1 Tax=Uliginosibacterium aquaticum TaxID=2731212 RepID=UPI001F300DEF|nr:DUF2325 domain-containing protein [Uliginosibacterium aquaticum]